jgi:adenylate kinase family enzyme
VESCLPLRGGSSLGKQVVMRPEAMLIVGPTGSGKTPLGDLLQERGLGGRRCHHFDFGAELRALTAAEEEPKPFSAEDVAFVRRVLAEGALLEDEDFHIAEKALGAFMARRSVREDDLVVLNGMPRHVGQAEAVDRLLTVGEVVMLSCTADVVCRRIATDAGGDREGRLDDCVERIGRKLETYRQRTEPLAAHYRACGARVRVFAVEADTRAREIAGRLEG